jgi:hypothetical protein
VRPKVIVARVAALERVIDALAVDLVESTDEELLQAAKDLGMDPTMRGSAAFIGLKYPVVRELSDFFEPPLPLSEQTRTDPALRSPSGRPGGRKKRAEPSDGGNNSE